MDAHDIRFMEHALALARKGTGLASPNPMVGCVIVRDGEIVAEGWHEYDRRDHAEIVALKSAREKARGATLYVNLEPCNHTGRTDPCTEAIIPAGIKRVVAAMQDPNPATSGGGFDRLRAAGIEITSGILEEDAQRLNEAFASWIRAKKPFVTLKSALTLDGQLALPGPRKRGRTTNWITSEESRAEVQRMRHASDALVTGIGTILADNPLLTDRTGLPRRRPLLRVILDTKLRLSPKSRIVQSVAPAFCRSRFSSPAALATSDLLAFTTAPLDSPKARALQRAGVELVHVRPRGKRIDLAAVLAALGKRDILSVLLEAGPSLNGAALSASLVDKLVLFYAPKIAGQAVLPFAHLPKLISAHSRDLRIHHFGPDLAIEARL